jgi:serine protease Do
MSRKRPMVFAGVGLIVGLAVASLLHFPATRSAADDANPDSEFADRAAQYVALNREVDQFDRQSNILKTVIKLTGPTVVHIDAERAEIPGRPRRATVEEAGSGAIVEVNGKNYVLTNRHVIKNHRSPDIKIRLADNRVISPQRIWSDEATDIAVMLVTEEGLIASRIGDSDRIEIGDAVLALGSPFGLSRSVTTGIISAKGRREQKLVETGMRLQDFLQTDAAINPGNSGGPLVNLRGEIVGVNTAILSNSGGFEGVGFSIPINMAMHVVRHLVDHDVVVRAFLGVQYDTEFGPSMASKLGLPRPYGARIESVTPGGPAELAKLQVNDVILNFDGIRIDDGPHLVNIVSMTDVDKEVPVVVWRDGRQLHLTAKVSSRKPQTAGLPR